MEVRICTLVGWIARETEEDQERDEETSPGPGVKHDNHVRKPLLVHSRRGFTNLKPEQRALGQEHGEAKVDECK